MVYRVGTDLAKTLHSSILHNKSKIDKLEESNQAMKKQIGHMLSDQNSSLKNKFSIEDSLKMLSYLYLCFTQSGFWVLFFSCVCWKPGAKLCGCHTVFHLNIHASQIPLFFINLFKKNYLIGFCFVLTIKIMPPRSSRKNKVNFKFWYICVCKFSMVMALAYSSSILN